MPLVGMALGHDHKSRGYIMRRMTTQLITASLIYEEIILSVEETTSGSRCGSSLAAFSRLASACPSDRVSRGVFLPLERS